MYAEYMIKSEARNSLTRNNWGKAIAVTVFVLGATLSIPWLIEIIRSILNINLKEEISNFSDIYINQAVIMEYFKSANPTSIIVYGSILFVILVLSFLILCPLSLGGSRFYYFVSNGESPSVGELFYYFKSKKMFFRSLKFYLNAILRVAIWGSICMLPWIIMLIVSGMMYTRSITSTTLNGYSIVLEYVATIFLFIGCMFFFVMILRYFLSSYLFVSNEEIRIKDCFKISFNCMVGYRGSVLKLYITFIPWFLLCFFVLPLLYVLPYFNTASFTCAKWLLVEMEKRKKKNNYQVEV